MYKPRGDHVPAVCVCLSAANLTYYGSHLSKVLCTFMTVCSRIWDYVQSFTFTQEVVSITNIRTYWKNTD